MRLNFIAAAVSTLLSSYALAEQPTVYSCSGIDEDIKLSFSTSSHIGQPHIKITVDGTEVTDLRNNFVDLVADETSLGELITARVNHKLIADAPTYLYAFFIPHLNHAQTHDLEFETVLVRGSVGGFLPPHVVPQTLRDAQPIKCSLIRPLF